MALRPLDFAQQFEETPARSVAWRVEPLTGRLAGEIEALGAKDDQETVLWREAKGPLDIDWAYFFAQAKAGRLEIITARDAGKLVGYFAYEFGYLPYHRTITQVQDIGIYLLPEYRRGLTGFKFLKACVERMQEAPAKIIKVSNMDSHDFGPLWKRLGFVREEISYSKVNPEKPDA